jgi:Holliday junction resolvase RusA-like endonuclease
MMEFKIDPVPKPRMTGSDRWKKRTVTTQYWNFKDKLVLLAKKKKFNLPEKYRVEFFIKMPDSWSLKKKLKYAGAPHKQRPDLDNLVKSIQDCLLSEDSKVWYTEASKIWWEEGRIIIYTLK